MNPSFETIFSIQHLPSYLEVNHTSHRPCCHEYRHSLRLSSHRDLCAQTTSCVHRQKENGAPAHAVRPFANSVNTNAVEQYYSPPNTDGFPSSPYRKSPGISQRSSGLGANRHLSRRAKNSSSSVPSGHEPSCTSQFYDTSKDDANHLSSSGQPCSTQAARRRSETAG